MRVSINLPVFAFVVGTMALGVGNVLAEPDPSDSERRGLERALQAVDPPASLTVQPRDAPVVPIRLVIRVGDTPGGGSVVSSLKIPATGDDGDVAVGGQIYDAADPDEFMWIDDSVGWTASGAGIAASDIEYWSDINADGSEFITSVGITDGALDSVVTSTGILLAEEDPAPDFPGNYVSFASRPLMTANGTAYWVSGFTDTLGGSTQGRVLYRATDTTTPFIEKVIASGDLIGGFTIQSPSGVDFDYFVSDNDLHRIQILDTTETSAADGFVAIDDSLVLREGDPINPSENWDNFDIVQINNDGHWIVTGDTDGDGASDEFLALDGTIVLREGANVGGVILGTSVRAAGINDHNQIAFVWTSAADSTDEVLFLADNPTAVDEAEVVLRKGSTVDMTGDGLIDGTVIDTFTAASAAQTLQFQEDGWIYIQADLDYNAGVVSSIIGVRSTRLFHDGFESASVAAWSSATGE